MDAIYNFGKVLLIVKICKFENEALENTISNGYP
jgi:hypothetical protein